VRIRRLLTLACLGLSVAVVAPPASGQDFDPRGRKKPGAPAKPGGTKPGGPAKPGAPAKPGPGPRPSGPGPGSTASDAGQSQTVLIERYTKITLQQPGAPFPLQRLAQLYRDKDGNLSGLVKDFETRAAQSGAEQYAATVSLAGIYKIDGRADDSIKTYEKAIGLKNTDPVAVLALARLLQDRGEIAGSRKRYEDVLALQTLPADRAQTLRTLMTIALDAKDFSGAKAFHQQLVKLEPTSFPVKGELARELFQRAEYEKSEAEFKDLVNAAAGDNRALAPALKDLGKAQAKAHKNQDALATLKKALQAAGQEAAVRAEIYETITEIYRADQQLPVLIKQLEDEHPSDFQRLAILGALYEETGDSAKALQTYTKALAVNPRQIDLRLKMIRVLQSQGELDKAIAEYEALIRAAPNNPQFVFEQCEALMQRGDRARALKLLTELEARAQGDEDVLARLADFYGRIGENDKSLKVLTRLSGIGTNDPGHLVDLGDRYFQDGNTQLAVQTWRRILGTVTPRARALAALGEVYLEHDMLQDALTSFREAVQLEPQTLAYKKQLAGALERSKSYKDARQIWQELSDKAKTNGDKILAREARSRIVTLWGFERILDSQIAPLQQKFGANPPDVEAGRMLAEVQLHLRKLADAETTLRKIVTAAPGDADSYLALERVLVQENKLQDAIAILEKLVAVDPKSARQLYQRMAQYALQLYRDDDAIKYAARAVELNPDDAEGHRRLGEMYRQKQDVEHAIVEFRAAIAKNDRLFIVYLELAELLLTKGQSEEADRLFRRVVRGAPDEELVSRAARLSMQINLGKGTLESLEQELLPLAIGNPQKKVYRRLLVEIYGNLTFALVQRVKNGSGKEVEEARASLQRIGGRAVKPLLDALADGDAGQQRVAIDVLGYVQNKNASAALFSFATGQGEAPLRTRAMLACGALRDPALLPKYESLLFPKADNGEAMASDAVARAASWAVAKLGDKRAIPLLRKVAQNGTPDMRAFALLGIGALKDKSSVPLLAQTARSLEAGAPARAAAAYALGEVGAESETTSLVAIAEGTDALPRQMAILALARMGATHKGGEPPGGKSSLNAMADAVFAGDAEGTRAHRTSESLRQAATAALVLLATKNAADPRVDAVPAPDEDADAETTLDQLVPRNLAAKDRAATLIAYADVLKRSASSALATSTERARAVLDAMGTSEGAFEPFIMASEDGPPEMATARAKVREIALGLEPSVVALSRHPDPSVRTKAIVLLARSKSDAASAAISQAVTDPSENVQRVALSSIGQLADQKSVTAVAKVMRSHEAWAMRVLAAQALGRLGAAGAGAEATRQLKEAATKEPYALVREAALVALASYDRGEAAQLATQMAAHDAEPRVRDTANKLRGAAPSK
jgi:cellulose synthase operon protein C